MSLAAEKLFAGSGEMRARCRAHDWEATALGAVEGWPPALRVLAPVVLAAGVPSALLWGSAQTVLYNDAYIPLLGAQHPVLLGRPHFDVVPESRATFGPLFARVGFGETVSLADVPTPFRRGALDGPLSTSFYTFSFAPVREADDPAGPVAGIHGIVSETTTEVARRATEARQAYLLALSDALRPLVDPVEIQGEAARLIGERLDVDRVLYAETQGDTIVVHRDWARGVASMAGRFDAALWGEYMEVYLRGEAYVVHDVACDPKVDATAEASYRSVDIAAFIGIGLIKRGAHVASFGVHSRTPRAWTGEEIELVRETAERIWAATERAHTEIALRESEAKYRTIFDSIDEGFGTHEVLYDGAGRPVDIRYLETNPAFERHTGVSGCVGRTVREISPNLEDAWIETFARVARTGLPLRFEQENADVGRWYNVYLSRVGGDGSPVVAAVFTDITERRRAEAALATAAARDAFLVRLADALRPIGDPVAVQAEAMRVLGEHFGAVRAQLWEVEPDGQHLVSAGGYARGMALIAARIRAEDYGVEVSTILRAGRTLAVADTATHPLVGEAERAVYRAMDIGSYVGVPLVKDGRWVAALGLHRGGAHDWTPDEVALVEEVAERTWAAVERARAEQALREGEERLRLFGEASSDVIWIRDAETLRMEYVSPAFEAIYGVQGDEVLGHEPEHVWADLIVPEDREGALAALERVRAGKRMTFEFRIRRPDGQLRWLRDTDFPVRDENGLIRRIGGIGQDVTQQKEAEGALRELNETLEQRVEHRTRELVREMAERSRAEEGRSMALRQLVNAEEEERRRISHELHDQMGQETTGLLLGLRALSGKVGPSAGLDDLEGLADKISRDIQSMAVGLRPPALDNLGLEPAVRGHLEEWSRRSGVQTDFHSAGLEGTRLLREIETTVYRVAQEGLNNVLKHAGADHVSLVLERRGGAVSLTLEDDGCGFDLQETLAFPEKAKRLGLRGMKERIGLLGGNLEIESTPGVGTTLFVRVPEPEEVVATDGTTASGVES